MKPHKCREPRSFLTRRTLARLIAGAVLAGAQAAHAQNLNLDLPAQSLEGALASVARQSGLQLALDPALAAGRNVPALNGQYTTAQALDRLLAGTGLQAVRRGETLVIQPAPRGRDVQLAPVTVTAGTGYSGTTEGTGSYTQKGPSRAATRLALTPKETPQSVSVVTRQRLDDQRLEKIVDVLEATVGVSTFRQSVGADLDQPYSRGFSISNYLVDGVSRSGSTRSTQMNTAAFDRVEILRGATGLTSGMGYPGASVNMVRKRPTREAQTSLSLEAGSWDRHGVGLDMAGPLTDSGHVRGRLVVDYKDQKSWLDRYETQRSLIYGITEIDLSNDTLLTLGFSHQKNDNDSPLRSGVTLYYSDGSKIGLPRSYNNAPDWSYSDIEESYAFASLRHSFSNGWKANLEFNYLKDRHDEISYWRTGSVDRATGLGQTMAPARWYGDGRQYDVDASLSGDFSLFGRSHEFVAGLSLSQRKNRSDNYGGYGGWLWPWNSSYDGTINSPIWEWDGSQANYPEFTKVSDGRGKTTEYTAYFSSRFNLTDQANLIVGARVMDWEDVSETIPLSGARSKTVKKETGVVVPYAGVTYDLNDTWTLYGSYTQIFQPQSASVVDINRKPLDPEEGSAYEVGVKAGFFDQKLNANLALFKVEQEKVAEFDATINAYKLLEGINTQGAEVELSGELADGWNVSAGYAYSVSEDKEGKRVMERIPRHTVKAFTTYRLPGELNRWTLGGGAIWQSRYGWEGAKDNGWDDQKSYVLANLMVRYELSGSTEITANLNNVFDKKYYTALADIGVYGPPRNFMLSLKHKF
ncbi:TonB-dependent siderophore receptor [Thauera linaloolentis]|uniref:TonB-dependent siderophore receptor n=1 Tax=Thauera linaloolentis (strain DSM 12138 / JCM 21573 / CCUG 41526 / CIP 105981 / IAM 15112 / NBRC 102519 / 47Lol) TaxID=1123367 RepID=N6YEN0_THAL4|nr:TonB-dependent siderophore receptor [Thauera linaloolentis]ENO89975.1 TonB-dependent siderophore receptor [Thauera linaloolentis 47Lol = DSM 12138]MCM8566598.1 TonB-dependent siderophore receptor [Thauera linaloolentis]